MDDENAEPISPEDLEQQFNLTRAPTLLDGFSELMGLIESPAKRLMDKGLNTIGIVAYQAASRDFVVQNGKLMSQDLVWFALSEAIIDEAKKLKIGISRVKDLFNIWLRLEESALIGIDADKLPTSPSFYRWFEAVVTLDESRRTKANAVRQHYYAWCYATKEKSYPWRTVSQWLDTKTDKFRRNDGIFYSLELVPLEAGGGL